MLSAQTDPHEGVPTPPSATAVRLIPYADETARFGVSSQRTPFGLRIVVPPLASWRQLPKGYFIAIAVLGFMTVLPLAEAIGLHQYEPALIIPTLEFGIPTLLVALYARHLLKRRIVLDVTREELAITLVDGAGRGRRMSWPRASGPSVSGSDVNGKLIVRCSGFDPKDIWLGPSRAVLHGVAEAVNAALAEELAPAPAGGAFPAVGQGSTPAHVPSGAIRIVAWPMLILALGMLLWQPAFGVLLLMVVLAFLVPYAGITRGTQDKEFFT